MNSIVVFSRQSLNLIKYMFIHSHSDDINVLRAFKVLSFVASWVIAVDNSDIEVSALITFPRIAVNDSVRQFQYLFSYVSSLLYKLSFRIFFEI